MTSSKYGSKSDRVIARTRRTEKLLLLQPRRKHEKNGATADVRRNLEHRLSRGVGLPKRGHLETNGKLPIDASVSHGEAALILKCTRQTLWRRVRLPNGEGN